MIMNTRKYLKKYGILFSILFIGIFLIWSQNDFIYRQIIAPTFSLDNAITKYKLMQDLNPRYILVWTLPTKDPIMNLEVGNKAFIKRNCPNTNCYVSSERTFFDNVSSFDVIVFHAPDISIRDLPKARSPHQKYVFASMESSDYYPMCNNIFNGYFNWTWTYKLNSDEEYSYISIWDKAGHVIGPKEVMHWKSVEEMEPIDDSLKRKLDTKKHAAAWFVSNCNTPSKRENVVKKLQIELEKHNLTLDVFGRCSQKKCPRFKSAECLRLLESDYYFYLSFENSFSDDYVTEKLLNALQYHTVPIVFGGANYTRFMPDGIYLDAQKLTTPDLAYKMAEIIKNKEKYYSYFKWRNHYSYHSTDDSPQTDAYCKLCSMISDEERFTKQSVYQNFARWWNPPNKC